MRKLLCSTLITLQLAAGVAAVPFHYAEAANHRMHRLRSPHFIVTSLDKRGIEVIGMRRLAQVYFLHVSDRFGTEALMAVDGYSAEIIGLLVLKLGSGVTRIASGTRGRHFVDLSYSFGYTVEWTVYESYTIITTEEISVTEEYVEVTYEETQEVVYEEVEDYAEGDLDQDTPEDAAGDQLAEDVVDDVNDGFVEASDVADEQPNAEEPSDLQSDDALTDDDVMEEADGPEDVADDMPDGQDADMPDDQDDTQADEVIEDDGGDDTADEAPIEEEAVDEDG